MDVVERYAKGYLHSPVGEVKGCFEGLPTQLRGGKEGVVRGL